MTDPDIRIVGELQKLSLAPGDVLVLTCARRFVDAELAAKALKDFFPSHNALVLEDGVKLGVVSPVPPVLDGTWVTAPDGTRTKL